MPFVSITPVWGRSNPNALALSRVFSIVFGLETKRKAGGAFFRSKKNIIKSFAVEKGRPERKRKLGHWREWAKGRNADLRWSSWRVKLLLDPHDRTFVDYGHNNAKLLALPLNRQILGRPKERQNEGPAPSVWREDDLDVLFRNLRRLLPGLEAFEVSEKHVSFTIHLYCLGGDERRCVNLYREIDLERPNYLRVELTPERLETLPRGCALRGRLAELLAQRLPIGPSRALGKVDVPSPGGAV